MLAKAAANVAGWAAADTEVLLGQLRGSGRAVLTEPQALSPLGPSHDVCPGTCCPNPRGARPALCERPG
jgi:hypothetical protein